MMAGYTRRGLYRSRKGEIFGVCQGIAEWRDLPVGPIRLAMILLAVFTGFAPMIIIYLLAALVLPLEPKGADRRYSGWDDFWGNDEKREPHFRQKRDPEQDWEDRFRNSR